MYVCLLQMMVYRRMGDAEKGVLIGVRALQERSILILGKKKGVWCA